MEDEEITHRIMAVMTKSAVKFVVISLTSFAGFCLIAFIYTRTSKKKKEQSSPKLSGRKKMINPDDFRSGSEEVNNSPWIPQSSDVSNVKSNTDALDLNQARILCDLLSGGTYDGMEHSSDIQRKALVTIANKAAFTYNNDVLRESGCLTRLSALIKSYHLAIAAGDSSILAGSGSAVLHSMLRAINNLAMDEKNQILLQNSLSSLLNLSSSQLCPAFIRISALEALTNFSITTAYHSQYLTNRDAMCTIIDYALDEAQTNKQLRLQSLRLLVNLSCSVECAIFLLNSKMFSLQVVDGFERYQDHSLTRRWLSIFNNVLDGQQLLKERNSDSQHNNTDSHQDLSTDIMQQCNNKNSLDCVQNVSRLSSDPVHKDRLIARIRQMINFHSDVDVRQLAISALDKLLAL